MKKIIVFVLMSVLLVSFAAAQQAHSANGGMAAEISFSYTRLNGMASNQFAIWIEDSNGQFIKTLFATRFTANGGWRRRPSSIPMWVQKSAASELSKTQIDAVSSATPRTGTLTYTWDGTNSAGISVPAGDYVIILEATLRGENQVYYRAPIRLGQGAATARVSTEYVGNAGDDRSMIGNVTVRTLR